MEEVQNSRISEDYGVNNEEKLNTKSEMQSVLNSTETVLPKTNEAPSTYIEIISEKDASGQPVSALEVDLIISREKGKETRRLSINFMGIDMEKKEMVEKSVDIDRQSFERLKDFFCNLDWNS